MSDGDGEEPERPRVGRRLRSAEDMAASDMAPERMDLVKTVQGLAEARYGLTAVWSKVRADALKRREELNELGITIPPSLAAPRSKFLSNQFGPRRNLRLKVNHPEWNTVRLVVHLSTRPEHDYADELAQIAWLWQQDHDGRIPPGYRGPLVPPPHHQGSGAMPAELLDQIRPYRLQLETAKEPQAAALRAELAYREELLARRIAQACALSAPEDQIQPVLEEILSEAGQQRAERLELGAGRAERWLATYLSVLADLRKVPVAHLAEHIGEPVNVIEQMLIAQWLPNPTQAARLARLVDGKPKLATSYCIAAHRDRATSDLSDRTPHAELLRLSRSDEAADDADNATTTFADNAPLLRAVPDLRPRTRMMLGQLAWLATGCGSITAGGWLVRVVTDDRGMALNVVLLAAAAGLLALCGVSFYRAFRSAT